MSQIDIQKKIKRVEHRIEQTRQKLASITERQESIKARGGKITEHGGWDVGYMTAKIAVLEDTLDDLKEIAKLLPEPVSLSKGEC